MFKMLKKFVSDERGLETVEYALMGGIFVVIVALGIEALATAVDSRFDKTALAVDPV